MNLPAGGYVCAGQHCAWSDDEVLRRTCTNLLGDAASSVQHVAFRDAFFSPNDGHAKLVYTSCTESNPATLEEHASLQKLVCCML